MAYAHGVFPLVYKTLKNYEELIPQEVLQTMKSDNMSIAKENMLMTSELIKVMKLLEENGIEAIAFKGPTLSQIAYGDIALRQYSDLDVLVKKDDSYTAAKILLEYFYTPMGSIDFLKNSAKLRTEKNYEFYHQKNRIKLELHWKLINTQFLAKFENYNLWDTSYKIQLNHFNIKVLNDELFLLYLCSHGSSHIWERIEWIVDVDKFITKKDDFLNWENVLDLGKALKSYDLLLLGLQLTHQILHTPLPQTILQKIKQHKNISHLTKTVINKLNSNSNNTMTENQTNIEEFNFYLAIKTTYLEKIRFILKTAFNYSDGDVMFMNLPKRYHFLYYFIRIYRIFKKYISPST